MYYKQIVLTVAACVLTGCLTTSEPLLIDTPHDTSKWGKNIQRTMELLETSTPEKRNKVKILFYGQSIIGGQWHVYVERALRKRFPYADLEVENLALGGYPSQLLVKTVETDVLMSRPDLVVFHVYGDHIRYEEIIHTIRQRTAAEIMIMTDHWMRRDWNDGQLHLSSWDGFFDRYLPLVAKKYACELVDVRWPWKTVLDKNNWMPDELLSDGSHLNDKGKRLMAQLALRQMLYRPELKNSCCKGLVKTLSIETSEIPGDIKWIGNSLEFEFDGSRVDLLSQHAGGASCTVTVDGQPVSSIPTLTYHTRTTSIARPYEWPEIQKIGFQKITEPQTWTLTIVSVDDVDQRAISFELEGSKTGPDGRGTNIEDFVSDSGKVTINADDWSLKRKGKAFSDGVIRPGMKIRWKTLRLGEDLYFPVGQLENDRVVSQVLVNGLRNTTHTIRLVADGIPPPITGIRIYRPILVDAPFEDMGVNPESDFNLNHVYEPTPRN